MKLLSPEFAYLCISTIRPCWAVTPSYYLDLLDKLQKWICRTVFLHLLLLLNPWLIVEMLSAEDFSIGITLVDAHLSWMNWFHFQLVPLPLKGYCKISDVFLRQRLTFENNLPLK